MTPVQHLEAAILKALEGKVYEQSMAELIVTVQQGLAPVAVRPAAIKSAVLALVSTERVELTDTLKLRIPAPPPAPATTVVDTLNKLLKDRDRKLLRKQEAPTYTHYEFEDIEPRDLPRELRHNVVRIIIDKTDSSKDRVYRSHRSVQKFLCVGGPLDRQWKLEDDAEDYRRFNNSSKSYRRRGEPKRPTAVLVHEGAFE